jgi:hypothetical protein
MRKSNSFIILYKQRIFYNETLIILRFKSLKLSLNSGSCSYFPPKKRSDGHRIVVLQNELDEKNNWKTPSLQGEQGFRFLQPIRGEGGIERHDRRGSNYKYIVKTKYERPEHRKGCNPILRVQFMASKEYKHDNVGIDKPSKFTDI